MPNTVYLFCGPAGSGKDTSYNFFRKIIQEKHPEQTILNYAFGDSLKEIVSDVTELYTGVHYPVENMQSLEYKEQPRPEYQIYINGQNQPLIIRKLLQQIGTNILRQKLGEDIFAECVIKKIKQQFKHPNQIAIITDLRFPNELKCIERYCDEKDHNFYTIYVERNGTLKSHSHISESFYDMMHKDFLVDNNGSLDDLNDRLKEIFIYNLDPFNFIFALFFEVIVAYFKMIAAKKTSTRA